MTYTDIKREEIATYPVWKTDIIKPEEPLKWLKRMFLLPPLTSIQIKEEYEKLQPIK